MNLYAVGKIIGCFGVRGDVKIHPTTHALRRMCALHNVVVGSSDHDAQPLVVERVVLRERIALIRFRNINNRNAAENLVGKFLFVCEDDVELPKAGAYFTHEIIGCDVYAADNHYLGIVEDVYKLPAQDVWAVRNGSKLYMIPAVKEFIEEVNLQERKIIINVIEGLIDE